jgi:hypothetical protein
MAATDFTLEMLSTLNKAIATGTQSVYYGDKRVDYRSLTDMIRTRNIMMVELGLAQPQTGRQFAEFNKGLSDRCGIEGDDSGW